MMRGAGPSVDGLADLVFFRRFGSRFSGHTQDIFIFFSGSELHSTVT